MLRLSRWHLLLRLVPLQSCASTILSLYNLVSLQYSLKRNFRVPAFSRRQHPY